MTARPGPLDPSDPHRSAAADVLARLTTSGQTLAVAESLTGGSLCAALVAVPGASAALRGGVVAYAVDAKTAVLGVPSELLARHGAVHPDVAVAMADGAARLLSATWAVATTGVAGPGPQDGREAGTVHLAVAGPRARQVSLRLPGDRDQVRAAAVHAALELLRDVLDAT